MRRPIKKIFFEPVNDPLIPAARVDLILGIRVQFLAAC
jgi:hypothetical protein